MNPQMHITFKLGVFFFFHKRCKENNNNRGAQWWHLWSDRQVSPLCLHMDDIFDVISFCCSKEEGCGSFKAHMRGSTGSNLSLSTPCPICINSYVTMVSVCNGLSSTAAVRGTGTETGNAHGWKTSPDIRPWLKGCSKGLKTTSQWRHMKKFKTIKPQRTTIVEMYLSAEVSSAKHNTSMLLLCEDSLTTLFVVKCLAVLF